MRPLHQQNAESVSEPSLQNSQHLEPITPKQYDVLDYSHCRILQKSGGPHAACSSHVLYKQTHTLSSWRGDIGRARSSVSATNLLLINENLNAVVKSFGVETQLLLCKASTSRLRAATAEQSAVR
jgi:hypothetical protein